MYSSTLTLGAPLAKRLVEDPPNYEGPSGLGWILAADFIVFLPIFLITAYTLTHVYPTLAAVEDPLPAYEALPIDDDGAPKPNDEPVHTAQPGQPITASLRATNRLIRSLGGWLANFRGFGYYFLVNLAVIIATGIISAPFFVPSSVGHLLALLGTAPLSTTWTHVVITAPSTKSFFSRIPPVNKVYLATWFPTFLFWAAIQASVILPTLLAYAIGLNLQTGETPSGSDAGKALAVAGLSLGIQASFVIPAHAALARVQASLLPADEDPLVPFDRSFAGRVEPEIITGKGFATFGAAIKTIPRASWIRIYLLRIKVFFVTMAAFSVFGLVLAAEILIAAAITGNKN
ncbi:hypothetical protein B0J18DRAFT_462301 [Chaetomium sp. MPI-SDFR-AT-0129]|nr:hypothetical protein B0J18DRAFT_462301 [Chaetomium sp. MPI-SDFR-AT-0129]